MMLTTEPSPDHMPPRTTRSRPPLTLIANSQEWHSRSLESILGPHGYAVLRAYTGRQAVERAQASRPDLIVLDTDLPDRDGLEVCRELRSVAEVGDATPIVITSPGHASRQRRLDALRSGATDFIGSALDGEELPLRLDALLRAKLAADRAKEESLLDEITGLYNLRGLALRARELGSQAFRQKEPLACVVLAPVMPGTAAPDVAAGGDVLEALAHALRETGRTSDAIGMLGPGEFAVVTQGTDPEGVFRLAERLSEAVARTGPQGVRVAAGIDAVPNYHESPIEPGDMFSRAASAMRLSRSDVTAAGDLRIRRFEGHLS